MSLIWLIFTSIWTIWLHPRNTLHHFLLRWQPLFISLCRLIASVCFHVNALPSLPLKHKNNVSTGDNKPRLRGTIRVCVCQYPAAPMVVRISGVVYCRAAPTDALQCISLRPLPVFVVTVITKDTHTHRDNQTQSLFICLSGAVICCWLWAYLFSNSECRRFPEPEPLWCLCLHCLCWRETILPTVKCSSLFFNKEIN